MTFDSMIDAVCGALNLSSAEARTRVGVKINLRLRQVQSTLGLENTRRGSADFTTTSGSPTVVASGIAKLLGLYDPDTLHDELIEYSLPEIIRLTAQNATVGTPTNFAIDDHIDDLIRLRLHPIPSSTATLEADCLLAGTALVDDDDEPTLPEDFHDILIRGALADELRKMAKWREAREEEAFFEKRLSELRYFLATSSTRTTRGALGLPPSGRKTWPFTNLA